MAVVPPLGSLDEGIVVGHGLLLRLGDAGVSVA